MASECAMSKNKLAWVPLVVAVAWAGAAHAEGRSDPAGSADDPRATLRWNAADHVDGAAPSDADVRERRVVDRPFLYMIDPRPPAPMTVVGEYAASLTSTEAAARPLAANVNRSGFVNELRVDFGLVDRLSIFGTGWLAPPTDGEAGARGAFAAGLRTLVTDPSSRIFRLALDGAFLRDFAAANGGFLNATATLDAGVLRLGAMVHSEKMFAPGRDDVDLYVVSGASVRTIDHLRVGAEYVAQDLEEVGDPGAEGGIRQFAGASLAWTADSISVAAGPAFGLGGHAPSLLGRVQASVAF